MGYYLALSGVSARCERRRSANNKAILCLQVTQYNPITTLRLRYTPSARWVLRYNLNMQLNQPAPDFELPDLQGALHKLSEYRGKIVIVNFWSAECPHSERTDRSTMACLVQWGGEVELLSIASNRSESVLRVEEVAKARRLPRVLIDAGHVVADEYEAVATPHVFVIDREGNPSLSRRGG